MEQPTASDHFLGLPDEIWLEIFSYFTGPQLCRIIAPVCKVWWRLSKDATLWPKEINFRISSEESRYYCCQLLKRCHLLNTLKIDSSVPIEQITECAPYLPLLQKVDFGFCEWFSDKCLGNLAAYCSQIEYLNLGSCNVGLNGVSHIVQLANLQSLNLSNCEYVDDECLKTIARHCRRLEYLNFDGVASITDMGVCELSECCSMSLLHLFLDGEGLTDLSLVALGACKKLQTLKLSCGNLFTDSGLLSLSNLPHLVSLKLHFSKKISKEAWANYFLTPTLKAVVSLDFHSLSLDDAGVQNLASTCRNVTTLSLQCCDQITDQGVKAILENCSQLTALDLKGLKSLSGKFLANIPSSLPKLEDLDLNECNKVDTSAAKELVEKMPNLIICGKDGFVIRRDSDESDED